MNDRDGNPAPPDAEVEGRVDLVVIELHQPVCAADADLGGAVGDEGGNVEGPQGFGDFPDQ